MTPVFRHVAPALAPVVPWVAQALEIPRTLPRAGGVAITFDDGPHPEGTPAVLAARATREIAAGDVILLHDADFYSARHSHRRTAEALPAIVAELKRRRLDTVLPV